MRIVGALGVAGFLVALVSGCGDGVGTTELSITGTGDGYTGLPDTLEAGLHEVTFRNDAPDGDGPLLISRGGRSVEEFMAEFAPVLEGGPVPGFITTVVGLPTTQPGTATTSTFTLPAGDYYWISFFESDREPLLVRVTVTGESPASDDLPDDAVVSAHDYGFSLSGIEAGTQTVTFRNDGAQEFHHGVFMQFPEGTTPAQAREDLATLFGLEEGDEPPPGLVEPEDLGDTAVFSPGTGGTVELAFEPGGTYAVLCFISDRAGGAPHAIAYDMMEVFRVGS